MNSNLSASNNYIWYLNSVLGKGATGYVFQGISKTNGESVAVKTFNQASKLRPDQVQMREFEVLRRVDHENIVKLLAVEEEVKTHSRVLVMELCTEGSLFTILDDPENAYGLVEEEFLLVLKHTSNGMKHLRDNNIVHRDLKPGNIMKYITEDGKSIYKLTDFGAARELEDDQQFVSLYGTEEYLHPDLYERAVLRKDARKTFGATVDLWSIGVTLYHVATGSLPFRPYGGRKNCETMYKITTQKLSGIISGVQTSPKGAIDWSYQLPPTCQLSNGVKKYITPILAGLMESNASLMWSFDKFFTEVTNVIGKRKVFVFYVDECKILTLFAELNDKLEKFRSLIQEQTNVSPEKQRLFFEQKYFDEIVDENTLINDYPDTSLEKPIFLLGNALPIINFEEQLPISFSPFLPTTSVDEDVVTAKLICSNGYFIKRSVEKAVLTFGLLKQFAQTMNIVVKNQFNKLKATIDHAETKSISATQKTKMLQSRHRTTAALLDLFENVKPAISEERNKLHLLVNSKQESSTTVMKQLNIFRTQLLSEYHKVVIEEQHENFWRNTPTYKNDLSKCPAYANSYVGKLKLCWQSYERNRKQRASSYVSNDPLNKLERLRIEDSKQKLYSIYQDQCLPALHEAFRDLGQSLSMVQRTINSSGNHEELQTLIDMLSVHDANLDEANETYDEIVQNQLIGLLSKHSRFAVNADSLSSVKSSGSAKLMIKKMKEINSTHTETMELLEMNQAIINQLQETSSSFNNWLSQEKCKI